jgi:hypothetical protein
MSARDRQSRDTIRARQRAKRGKGEPGRPRRHRASEPSTAPATDSTPINGPAGVVYDGVRVTAWTAAMLRRRDHGEQQ